MNDSGFMNPNTDEMTIIQIVPQRTIKPNGVADYALGLAVALRASSGINSVFLSANSSADASPPQDGWVTTTLPQRRSHCLANTVQKLLEESDARAVLLHFSGYGFQKRGVPSWLKRGVRLWRGRKRHIPLITVFHELYASGRPWQSSFWLSGVQRKIAREILALSSAAITPTEIAKVRLIDWADSQTEIICMPVFSTVGEPERSSAPCIRTASAVVFGLAGVEDRLFGLYRPQIERILKVLGIAEILDIGPRGRSVPRYLGDVPIISVGSLPRLAVSEALQRAKFGFLAYPFDCIGKSSVFAAYAAHGVIPIALSNRTACFDGLEPGRHFIDGLRVNASIAGEDLATTQRNLFTWYESHSSQVQANVLSKLIMRMTSDEK
jgi:hypothetical protein